MATSGVRVNDESLTAFQELKLRKKHNFIVYTLNNDNTEIIVERSGTEKYPEFIATLPRTECRYAVYDFQFDTKDGVRNKIIFLTWSPDIAKIKNKMLFSTSKDALRRALVGVAIEIQGTDPDEISYETVLEKASRTR